MILANLVHRRAAVAQNKAKGLSRRIQAEHIEQKRGLKVSLVKKHVKG